MQRHLEYAPGFGVAYFAVGLDEIIAAKVAATGANNKLADAMLRILLPTFVLGSKPFVVVPGGNQHDIGAVIVERIPQLMGRSLFGLGRTESRAMPIGQRALAIIGGQIGA